MDLQKKVKKAGYFLIRKTSLKPAASPPGFRLVPGKHKRPRQEPGGGV
ncbi:MULTISPECIES: hypothetical protein [Spirosoma]|nr:MULTISPECIES: hypothetical protein [Spirosoma]